jgi:hypothetical protein
MVRRETGARSGTQRREVGVVRIPSESPRNRANKEASKSALPPTHGEECGFEIIGGKRIPFVRSQVDKDYWTTIYGSHDPADHSFVRAEEIGGRLKTVHGTTLLVRHERRDQSSWGVEFNGRQSVSGRAANKLQGIIDTREGDELIGLVNHLTRFPFEIWDPETDESEIKDPLDYGHAWARLCDRIRKAHNAELDRLVGKYAAGWSLLCFIVRDIDGRHARYTQVLERVIEAQSIPEQETSIAARIIEALRVCANRLDRVPLKKEVRAEYRARGGVDTCDGDFSKELAKAGLNWLPVKL